MGPEQVQNPRPRRAKAWTFLRMFRWAVYIVFAALMLFLAVCVAVGIAANITERYPELEVTHGAGDRVDLGAIQLRDCREALQRMRQEDLAQIQLAFSGELERHAFWRQYRRWDRQWRTRLEKLGVSCQLTAVGEDAPAVQRSLAGVYRRLDQLHRSHRSLVKGYITENARPLHEMRELLHRSRDQLGMPVGDQGGGG